MITREHRNGPFVIQCDDCQDAEELEGTDFTDALSDARERGYRPFKVGGEWIHSCRICQLDRDGSAAA